MTAATTQRRLFGAGAALATRELAAGHPIGHAFANFYVITTRADRGFLYITSANRSRRLTGADDSPAHWTAAGLDAEFGDERGFVLLEHPDEAAARARYPRYLPMSTTILGFHRVVRVPGDTRPQLTLERHGSLHVDDLRAVLDGLGFGLVLGPKAATRLTQRDYSERLPDR